MKKTLVSLLMVIAITLSCYAADNSMGIQMIGGPGVDTTPVSLDNMKVGETVTIDGYGRITITEVGTIDIIDYYQQGKRNIGDWGNDNRRRENSGVEAEFYIVKMDIVNLSLQPTNFLKNCTVVATYDDVYKFGGWCHQFNWNNTFGYGTDTNKKAYIDDADQFEISPMYAGHYIFGVTLPNAVIEADEPLSIVINIGGNELTYVVRK